MNQKICKKLIENKKKFIPHLFTAKQINILEKYLNKETMTKTEKTYLYSTISKKTESLNIFKEEYYITGNNFIHDRIQKAKEILKQFNKKAFISGSFLYKEKYNDIDIFIISKKRKQYHKEEKHFIYITEKDLKKPIYLSAAKYSISNFFIEKTLPIIKKPNFDDLLSTYEEAIIEIIDNDDQKELRNLIFEYFLQIKNKVLDSFELTDKFRKAKKLNTKQRINYTNNITKELLLNIYSNKYVYNELSPFTTKIKKQASEYKTNENLLIYIDLFNEIKNECRRAQA